MSSLKGKTAVVTGASQGIGRAVAKALHSSGVNLYLIGRSAVRLRGVAAECNRANVSTPVSVEADLSKPADIVKAASSLKESHNGLDILINCGGIYARGPWDINAIEDTRSLIETNVIGPIGLTMQLLPLLEFARGDIVFVNSSIVLSDGRNAGRFAITQHALRSFANSLRAEVNERGIRVLSVYPGRTATPRQEAIHDSEERRYEPERLLQPADIAETIVSSLRLAGTAEVTDLHIRPRYKN